MKRVLPLSDIAASPICHHRACPGDPDKDGTVP
jgi:hypothetical protein